MKYYIAAAISMLLFGCENPDNHSTNKKNNTDPIVERAKAIAQRIIIADTHVDVPYRLEEKWEDVSQATQSGEFDYPRAKQGGLNAPFMSIYVPAELEAQGGSKALADKLIDDVEKIVTKAPEKFAIAYSWKDIEEHFAKGIISLPMGMENGSPIESDLANVSHFYQRGIRYITLAHSLSNHISDSSYDENKPAGGLTQFGEKVVREMNRLGMMVDVSHLSDEAFYDVLSISKAPVIASHSSARHFTPGFERNMSDQMIKDLAANDGVIFINFGSTFISDVARKDYGIYKTAFNEFLTQNNLTEESDEAKQFTKAYRNSNPFPYADLNDVLNHFDHVVKLVGIDHVGIGSDYDGVGDSLPTGLKDVASYPKLIEGLLLRGYSESEIEKIGFGNLKRVWMAVERQANQAQATPQETNPKVG